MNLYFKKLTRKKPNIFQKLLRKIVIQLESIRGIDFSSVNSLEELGLNQQLVSKCSPSGNKFLYRTILSLNVNNKDSILDIGCGKVSAIRVFLKFNFSKIDGIDLSANLISIAQSNFLKFKMSKP